jgi:glutaredoxin
MESSNVDQSENKQSKENPIKVDQELNDSENHSISNKNDQGKDDEFSEIEIQGEVKEIQHPQEEEEEEEEYRDDISETSSSSMTDKSSHDSLGSNKMSDDAAIHQPHSQLPRPEAPPGHSSSNAEVSFQRSQSLSVDMPAIGKFILERSSSFSTAIVKRLSSLKENNNNADASNTTAKSGGVTEFDLSGMKVVVKVKSNVELKGRISFFSRSDCRDCTAVRKFFREKGLKYVEINVDVYPQREKELVERTGNSSVPQIFFNEKLFGGLVALNSLRNSGGFDRRLKEMLGSKCPDDAPAPPVYGFDDIEDEWADEMVGIVRVLRQRLPIQDRLMKMKMVKNCFSGSEMVEVLIHHLDCGRKKVRTLALNRR